MKNTTALLINIMLSLSIANAISVDTLSRPKIGLVLSGGAAKGLAHIGVLKVLEEVGITPDYITGTSMGAVVGGLYALGFSADEISEMAETVDWNYLLSDRLPLNKVAFEEKYEYNRYFFGIPIRNYKFKLPSGVIVGQQLEKLFADLMWPLEEETDFDSLPIPFGCMGVDLLSGDVVEFKSGNLAECIRASMSIPSIFAPESIDSMLLVDGGTLRNFPVHEVKEMGADIVIGVYVGFEDKVTKEDMFSMTNVLSRSTVLQGIVDSKEQSKSVDIYIEPELKGLGAGDFTKASRLIELGRLSALNHKVEFMELKDSIELSQNEIHKKIVPGKVKISSIHVINDREFISDRFVVARSGIEEGDVVSKEILNEAVDNIYGTQYFQKVNYSLEKQSNGTYTLLFKVKEYTRAFLNFAAHHNNQYGTGLNTNLTLRNYIISETRALVNLNIAKNPNVIIDINKYFGNRQRFMKRVFFEWNLYENYMYRNGIDIGVYKLNSIKGGIGGKYSISTNHQIGVDGFYEKQKISPGSNLKNYFGTESFKDYSFKGFAYKFYYQANSTDNKFFPKTGIKVDVWYKYFYNPSISYSINEEDRQVVDDIVLFRDNRQDFSMMYMNLEKYITFFNTITLNVGASSGISSDESIGMGNFVLGGVHHDRRQHYIPFAGKDFAENIIPNFGLIKAGVDLKVFPDIYLSTRLNICTISSTKSVLLENVRTRNIESFQKGFCAGIQANTIIGPVSLMAGGTDYDNSINWYINIGYPF